MDQPIKAAFVFVCTSLGSILAMLGHLQGYLPAYMIGLIALGFFALAGHGANVWESRQAKRQKKADGPLEIIFDPNNPARRFWSMESPRDENGNQKPGVFLEYRADIKNNSSETLRNVSVTIEHIGHLPVRPVDTTFDKIKNISCDLKPGCSELIAVVRWPIPKLQPGMLAGPSAWAYGPIKLTASADDVHPAERIFQFDYQAEPMLFD
ncbi:MAG: hypothetical protein ACR2KT_09720 [Methylocella sp.]